MWVDHRSPIVQSTVMVQFDLYVDYSLLVQCKHIYSIMYIHTYASEAVTICTYLIKSRIYVIGELYLCDGRGALGSQPNGERHDPLLTQWGVEHSFLPCDCRITREHMYVCGHECIQVYLDIRT